MERIGNWARTLPEVKSIRVLCMLGAFFIAAVPALYADSISEYSSLSIARRLAGLSYEATNDAMDIIVLAPEMDGAFGGGVRDTARNVQKSLIQYCGGYKGVHAFADSHLGKSVYMLVRNTAFVDYRSSGAVGELLESAQFALFSTVRKKGETYSVSALLFDIRTGRHLARATADGVAAVKALYGDAGACAQVAAAIFGAMQVEQGEPAPEPPDIPEEDAWDAAVSPSSSVKRTSKVFATPWPRNSMTFGFAYVGNGYFDGYGAFMEFFCTPIGRWVYIDWLNFIVSTAFYSASIDAGVHIPLGRFYPFVRGGVGRYLSLESGAKQFYSDYYLEKHNGERKNESGVMFKIGLGTDFRLSEKWKATIGYDLYFLNGSDANTADGIRFGLSFGKPSKK